MISRALLRTDLTPPSELADQPRAEIAWRRQHAHEIVYGGFDAWPTARPFAQLTTTREVVDA